MFRNVEFVVRLKKSVGKFETEKQNSKASFKYMTKNLPCFGIRYDLYIALLIKILARPQTMGDTIFRLYKERYNKGV